MSRALAAVLAVSVGGCSTTATITRLNGPPVEGSIEGGTDQAIVVETESGTYAIPRKSVSDINHPGDVHAAVGAGIAAFGVLNIIAGLPTCSDDRKFQSGSEQTAFCVGVFVPVVVGASMMLWGLATYGRSTGKADETWFRQPEGTPPYPVLPDSPSPSPAYPYGPPGPTAPPPASTAARRRAVPTQSTPVPTSPSQSGPMQAPDTRTSD